MTQLLALPAEDDAEKSRLETKLAQRRERLAQARERVMETASQLLEIENRQVARVIDQVTVEEFFDDSVVRDWIVTREWGDGAGHAQLHDFIESAFTSLLGDGRGFYSFTRLFDDTEDLVIAAPIVALSAGQDVTAPSSALRRLAPVLVEDQRRAGRAPCAGQARLEVLFDLACDDPSGAGQDGETTSVELLLAADGSAELVRSRCGTALVSGTVEDVLAWAAARTT